MRRAVLCLLLFALASSAFAEELAGLIETYENPALGASSKVGNLTIGISNITIELTGSVAPVKVGDRVYGLFFAGSGKYTYQTNDAMEAGLVMFEAKKASKIKAERHDNSVTLTDTFNRMFLRTGGVALPELPQEPGAALDAQFREHREALGHARVMPASHLLARQKLDKPLSPVAWVEFDGDENTLYVLDTVDDKSEVLMSLVRLPYGPTSELRNALFAITISEQPVARDRKNFLDPSYLLGAIDYTLTGNADETAKLSMDETITPRATAQRSFSFNLHSRIWDTGGKPRDYHVDRITDESGKDLQFHHALGHLIVAFPAKIAANTPAKIHFEISGNYLHHPGGDSFWQLGTEPWFPQPDLNGQYYTIHSVVKVHKPWIAFAPGDTIRRGEEGDYNVVETKIAKPVQFAVVHAGKYATYEEKHDDLTVRVASYGGNDHLAMTKLANLAWKMIKFYEPWLGPFPFKEFNIIQIDALGFGQAPPATMFITNEAFNPLQGDLNKLFSQGINHRFAHEIAHQYWGHVVKMGSVEEQWVTEAFAEYCSSLVVKKLKGDSYYDGMVATWKANAKDSAAVAPIALANRIRDPRDGRQSFLDRTFILYDKGAYVLAVLHKQLGDQKFFTFLRSLQGFYEWKYLTTKDMAALLQRIDGKDYMPFFEKYYWGTEMPEMPKG
ncbi:MAG TPA: M1 family aminopeptidase [Thermoanaerobaculia bacterium]|nr:M1 family aminopeptidase [Thermoanaerobaculia bacterium]